VSTKSPHLRGNECYKQTTVIIVKLFRLILALLTAFLFNSPEISAQSPGTSTSSVQPNSASTAATASAAQDDAAAKVAERRRHFEAEKARIEAAGPSSSTSTAATEPCQASESDLMLSPNFVNMFVGATQLFSLFDHDGHKLTSAADWSIEDSSIAELTIDKDGTPVLTGKQTGKTRLTAHAETRSSEAHINVINPRDMTSGTINSAWLAKPAPCSKPTGIVPAARSRLPDLSISSQALCAPPGNGLSISPNFGNMLVNNTQQFNLLETRSNTLTTQAEWSVSDSSIAELTVANGIPQLTGKRPGTIRLAVHVDSRSAEAVINVVTQEDVRSGAVRLGLETIPCAPTR
jgi:hypothetical protein